MNTTTQATDNELALLNAIVNSEYNDSTGREHVWVDCLPGFSRSAKFGGVMASLVNKELAFTDGTICRVTERGLALVREIK